MAVSPFSRILFSEPLKLSWKHPEIPKLEIEVLVSQKRKVYFEKYIKNVEKTYKTFVLGVIQF